ncbi:hypothetical protein [Succinimonas sp.]|uniref:hypothetical protein n=1 Tax=Succinimonas sp. TaxID=1936151 RepID=UPI0038651CB5
MGSLSNVLEKWYMKEGLAQGREEARQDMQQELDDMNTKIDDMNAKMSKMQEQILVGIRILSDSCGIAAEEVMNRIGIPEPDQAMYLKLLQES